MASLPGSFNADDHGDMGFEPIPKDNYVLQIVESDYKPNSNRNGHFLSLKMEVQEGEYKGRIIYRNLNLDNPSSKAVEIANKELATICRACSKTRGIEDSEELHGIDFIASIVVKKGSGDSADQNEVQSYKPLSGAERPARPDADDGDEKPVAKKGGGKPIFDDEDED